MTAGQQSIFPAVLTLRSLRCCQDGISPTSPCSGRTEPLRSVRPSVIGGTPLIDDLEMAWLWETSPTYRTVAPSLSHRPTSPGTYLSLDSR